MGKIAVTDFNLDKTTRGGYGFRKRQEGIAHAFRQIGFFSGGALTTIKSDR